jgi:hypothetical protein
MQQSVNLISTDVLSAHAQTYYDLDGLKQTCSMYLIEQKSLRYVNLALMIFFFD